MAITISVPYSTMYDQGISESTDEGGPRAVVRFKCLWDDHYQLVQDLVGAVRRSADTIIRDTPFPYPANSKMYCTGIASVEGHGNGALSRFFPANWLPRRRAVVTANFSVPTFALPGNPGEAWTTVTFGASAEFLTLPGSTYRFADGTPTNTPIGKVIPTIEVNVKRHRMPYLPIAQIAATLGTINNAPFQVAGFPFAAGTLLFVGGPSEIEADTTGTVTQTVEYRFLFRPINWNFYLHPNRTTGFAAVTDGSGNSPYLPGDFAVLP
jgi:hypothetical protein